MSDEMKFEEDGRVHFEVTRWQRRRTIWYANVAEFCYIRSLNPGSWMPGTWRRLGDFFVRRVFFFSQGGIPVPKDRKHTNAFRDHVGLKPLEQRNDELNALTADWVRRSNVEGSEDDHQERASFDSFKESMARKERS